MKNLSPRRFAQLCVVFLLVAAAYGQLSRKFDHIIVVMEENRSFDHLLGWSKQLGVNGLTGSESNPLSTLQANSPRVYVDADAPYIAPVDPDHTTYATTSKIYGMRQLLEKNYTETMQGFVEWEHLRGAENSTRYGRVMSMFSPDRLPVLNQLASEFTVMDRFFASVPGCTWPNRQFAMAATSGGNTETFFWYNGTPGLLYPQKTIFDQLSEEGLTWKNYYVDSPWELMMESVAHNPENVQTMDRFFEDAATGNLPNYAFINPRGGINITTGEGSNDMHPDHDVALAEAFYKNIYETLRASPKWNRTLMILTFDEHGGFYDHVTPPTDGIPTPDDHDSVPDFYFKFDRLGLRIVTLLISPLVPKGAVISEPPAAQKPTNTSEYDLTSIMATVRKLYNMSSGPLTRRDAWAATFEHAFTQETPRTDCPEVLVPAPPPTNDPSDREENRPISHLQENIATMVHQLTAEGHTTSDISRLSAALRAPPSSMTRQGELSSWLQGRYDHHHKQTMHWKKMKSAPLHELPYKVVVSATLSPDWAFGDYAWNISRGNETVCPYVTIATRQLKDETTGAPYCLRHNVSVGNHSDGQPVVSILPCYPTNVACYNRDPSQHWIQRETDATISPHSRPDLCLTTNYNYGDTTVYLNPCNGSVTQHWSWFGPAPGDFDRGFLFFGIGVANLGVVV